MKALTSNWTVITLLGVLSYLGATVALLRPGKVTGPQSQGALKGFGLLEGTGPSWNFNNPELEQFIVELKKEREALAVRENQLNELAVRLQAERMEMNQVTQMVYQLQREFDATVLRVREEETPNLKKLAKVYSAMSPDGAAKIMQELNDEQLVKILVFMKEAETAPILENIGKKSQADAKRAALLSERLRQAIYRNSTPAKKP